MFKIKRTKNRQYSLSIYDLGNSEHESHSENYTQKKGAITAMMSIMEATLGRGIIYIDETTADKTYHWLDELGRKGTFRDKADFMAGKQVRKEQWEMIKINLKKGINL